ncbi:glycerol-3-phosphate dehydrogenase [Mangrovicoccus algicola]|uniref:Glycerol-3-phosphate dehydrogenase n=1 Tax=Mangrovicoccus algicola TaxID=2771008 RepID=A0A8J6YYJ2_9RHOB|nr:glycerol-3-phosphate dehydrogenase [Mangrovicoccus algicola]MBE3638346.1 glycerol-3-phosphate dehydrogenase [Mangrovicoccus algicola]
MTPDLDLLIIGGGINGCGIARDAAGRGLSVGLAEMDDLASATSSASTKLFHGGLRYLEFFEFRLVREALVEREVLLRAMPHISWPMRFVLPYHRDMRFESETPTSRLLSTVMPWMKGRRPAWLIRFGLFLYDHLGGRKVLPGTRNVDLQTDAAGKPLKDKFAKAYEYSDCWVQDSRLVVLNARDAEARGARIWTRTRLIAAERDADHWVATLEDVTTGATRRVSARMLVNAAGPWVGETLKDVLKVETPDRVRLVRGSHIVVPKLHDHDRAYFFQGEDGRIIFAIPYEEEFTLIGTTDQEHADPGQRPVCTEEEAAYLCRFASQYFEVPVRREDVVWTYSGVRPLYDDGARSATAATRDYTLKLETSGAPLLNVFGGKITTYRRLAEHALERIAEVLKVDAPAWTAGAPLPGGDFPVDGVQDQIDGLRAAFPFLDETWARRLVRAYGTEAQVMFEGAQGPEDLGRSFGGSLTEREVEWLMRHEYARCAADVLWRRGKLGLRLDAAQAEALDGWMAGRAAAPAAAG